MAPVHLATVCFRYRLEGMDDEEALNALNAERIEALNDTGKLYLTHTKLDGKYVIRLVVGQTEVTARHVEAAWELIRERA